jgi:hypothetical protein
MRAPALSPEVHTWTIRSASKFARVVPNTKPHILFGEKRSVRAKSGRPEGGGAGTENHASPSTGDAHPPRSSPGPSRRADAPIANVLLQ